MHQPDFRVLLKQVLLKPQSGICGFSLSIVCSLYDLALSQIQVKKHTHNAGYYTEKIFLNDYYLFFHVVLGYILPLSHAQNSC